ncbi:hypothetical protein P7C70_g8857, partial [Phenoliferia sp. Uapishka_3]
SALAAAADEEEDPEEDKEEEEEPAGSVVGRIQPSAKGKERAVEDLPAAKTGHPTTNPPDLFPTAASTVSHHSPTGSPPPDTGVRDPDVKKPPVGILAKAGGSKRANETFSTSLLSFVTRSPRVLTQTKVTSEQVLTLSPPLGLAPYLGPGGHAFHLHLPTVEDTSDLANLKQKSRLWSQSFEARCKFCPYTTTRTSTPAEAIRLWRKRHARLHGIVTWDLGLFHPSLPLNIIPSSVPRADGTGLVYFSQRAQAIKIFDYAALIGESRYQARVALGISTPGDEGWASAQIPADEAARLFRKTQLTASVIALSPGKSVRVDAGSFLGVSLSGFNKEDPLLAAVGEDFDEITFGSLLWFWIFGARARHASLVSKGEILDGDESWEDYRVGLYDAIHAYALRASMCDDGNVNAELLFSGSERYNLFQVTALPDQARTPFSSVPTDSRTNLSASEAFFGPLQSQIIASSIQPFNSAHFEMDASLAGQWLELLRGGAEQETWVNSRWAREIHEETLGWPRVVSVWMSLTGVERESWRRHLDPARTARRAQKLESEGSKARASTQEKSVGLRRSKLSQERSLRAFARGALGVTGNEGVLSP